MDIWTPTAYELRNAQYERNLTAPLTELCAVPCSVPFIVPPSERVLLVFINNARPLRGSTLLSVLIIVA